MPVEGKKKNTPLRGEGGGPVDGHSMNVRKRQKILRRISKLNDALIDLKREFEDQRFSRSSPAMKDLAKMKILFLSIVDKLDESIEMSRINRKFTLEEDTDARH